MVPGIAPTADPSPFPFLHTDKYICNSADESAVLQARMFAYPDAARYRVGANYQQLPTNAAKVPVYSPFERDGFMNFKGNYGPDPNYVRSTLRPMNYGPATVAHDHWVGNVTAFTSEVTDEDFVQPRAMWEMFGKTGQQKTVVKNISGHLKLAIPEVQGEAISKSFCSSIVRLTERSLRCRDICEGGSGSCPED